MDCPWPIAPLFLYCLIWQLLGLCFQTALITVRPNSDLGRTPPLLSLVNLFLLTIYWVQHLAFIECQEVSWATLSLFLHLMNTWLFTLIQPDVL